MSSLVERRSWKFPHPTLTSYHHLLASLCYLGSLDSLDRLAGAARASVEPCAQAMGYDGLLKQSACCQTTAYHQRNTLLVHAARPHSKSVPSLVLASRGCMGPSTHASQPPARLGILRDCTSCSSSQYLVGDVRTLVLAALIWTSRLDASATISGKLLTAAVHLRLSRRYPHFEIHSERLLPCLRLTHFQRACLRPVTSARR